MKVSLIYAYWPNQPAGVTWCDLPWALRDKGLPKQLHQAGHEVIETMLMAEEPFPEEMQSGLMLAAEISQAVKEAVDQGELAVVLAGSCAVSAIGAVGGIGADTAIAWLDAHPDLNTPETSTSGLLEGMALAAATGHAWREMARVHAGLDRPADLSRAALFGARDIDEAEQSLMTAHSAVLANSPAELIDRVNSLSAPVYAHLDMDVHDALQVRANAFAVDGGPKSAEVREVLLGLKSLRCLGITGLDPAAPDAGKAAEIAIEHVLAVANAPG